VTTNSLESVIFVVFSQLFLIAAHKNKQKKNIMHTSANQTTQIINNNMKSACILFITVLLMGSADAFMVSPPSSSSSSSQLRTSLAYASDGTLQPYPSSPSFGSRVIEAVKARTSSAVRSRTATTTKNKTTTPGRPAHVEEVMTLAEYKSIVSDEKDQIVVVRFYAPWCRSCKAQAPSYYKFTRDYAETENVKFVDCPMTSINSELHTTLGITSIPFAHVYHPDAGLVEERKLARKSYSNFEKVVKTYIEGSSFLVDGDCSNPWEEEAKEVSSDIVV
jgi:thiol-disulfide isomerase/thioredoxin